MTRHELVVPELGLGDRPLNLSLWLVKAGSEVNEGDRVVEVVSDGVSIDLPAPASGRLVRTLVLEDAPIKVGQSLGLIDSVAEET
jgi:2-oxoglutarate dehydrogenase E2 component (dihydrolipoamide succinyltransferase)